MGVPLNTLLVFLLCQILQFGSISGLPFASISSLSSLNTETAPNEELSAYVPNLVKRDSLVPSPGSSSSNFQLFFGIPIGNTNYALSPNPSVTEGGYGISSLDTLTINVPTSFKIQPNCISSAPVSEPSSSIEVTLDVTPPVSSTSSSSGSSTAPVSNKGSKSDLKRDLRDTIIQEPCFSVTQDNLAKLTTNCVSNFPSTVFPSMRSLPNINNFVCYSEDSWELSNGESECTFASPFQSPMLSKMNPGPSYQNNLFCSQENPNMLLALNLLNKRAQNSGEIDSAAQSNSCSENFEAVTLNPTLTSLANTLSSFEDIQNCKQTLQSNRIQNQPTIQTKLSSSQMNRLNNSLINYQVLQNNKRASPFLQSNINCEDTMQNKALKTEYDNVLRIRNSVIPNMLSNNVRVKSIPTNVPRNNEENRGCPQLETIQDNTPFIKKKNILLNPTNECRSENNNCVTGSTSFNNLARKHKYNLDDNESNGITVQNNNSQGCPQLTSIPVYNKESLLSKQLCQNNNFKPARALKNNCVNVNNNNLNQNVESCSQLLSTAQNNLYAKKNNEQVQNFDCNCIQTPTPNDNLAQALKMVNRAKTANDLASTINILPFGETLLDGKPLSNNLMSVESISSPTNLPTCPCLKSGITKPFLTIQDVSSTTFPATPVNSFPCSTPLEAPGPIPTNVMLAPSFNPINTMPPIIKNIKMTASVPTISSITNTESPIANPPLIFTQEPYYNSNIQPMFSLLSTPNGISPIVTPNFIPVESLPQVSFVNNLPSSIASVTPSLSFPNNYISSMSNLPPICSSIQPVVSPSYPSMPSNLQANSLSGVSSMFPSLNMNNMVSSLTQNIISTLMSQTSSRTPLGKLPPVNPFTPNLITENSSVTSPVCLDISRPSNYIVSTPLNLPGLSLPNIPVACNEYLPPMYNPTIIPISTFNPDLFYVGSDTAFDCGPFALSATDAYYPEISFMTPSVGTDSCLCGPLFMPANTLPQSPSVMRINNAGRDAKGFEQLLNCRMI